MGNGEAGTALWGLRQRAGGKHPAGAPRTHTSQETGCLSRVLRAKQVSDGHML